MALLNNVIRRILGPMSFPRFPVAQQQTVMQVSEPPLQTKVTSVPAPIIKPTA